MQTREIVRGDDPARGVRHLGEQARDLRALLERRHPGWIAVHGAEGTGKGRLLSLALAPDEAVVVRASAVAEEDLLEDFRAALRSAFGELPVAAGPGILPEPGEEAGWRTLLLGLAGRPAGARRRPVLVFDGWDRLVSLRRRLPAELAEALELAERRGGGLLAILTLRGGPSSPALKGLPEPVARIRRGPLGMREAARAHGGRDARDAFLRWACLGSHPAHLPPPSVAPGESWEEAVLARVLQRGGDLHDAPLRRLLATFQRPARYGSLLRALARGPMDWARLRAAAGGISAGGQMAPYLQRLEEEGLVVVERPLGAEAGSRNRRYRLADPFWGFWMGLVLPVRGELLLGDPAAVWRERILPRLPGHLDRWIPIAAREWCERHARERMPAPCREVGGVWDEDAEFQTVAWLTNGQVCYVEAAWSQEPGGAARYDDLRERMAATRHGIGREARAPVLALPGGADEALRRRMAREPLGRVLGLDDLMGAGFA